MSGSSPALLGMPDTCIKTLDVLTINYETTGRQLTPDDNPEKGRETAKVKTTVQTEGGKPESCVKNR